MTFSYRGANYQMEDEVLEATAIRHAGKYRGVSHNVLQVKDVINPPAPPARATAALCYRGVRYGAAPRQRADSRKPVPVFFGFGLLGQLRLSKSLSK